jgi:hypothetical protein
MKKTKVLGNIKVIKFKAEAILRREVMEANCSNFTELADKMAEGIINICNEIINKKEFINEKKIKR